MNHRGYHDVGGMPGGSIDRTERPMMFWEKRMEAVRDCISRGERPLMSVDEMRRVIETMGKDAYNALGFYEKKAAAVRDVLIEKGVLDPIELATRTELVRASREAAIQNLPESFDHLHDHGNFREDDPIPSEYSLISEAVYTCLVDQKLLSADAVSRMIERMEEAGPALGARITARAWRDKDFKEALLKDAKSALLGIGIEPLEAGFQVVENTPQIHNIIVCTLCSCYPRSILGAPPAWYVSKAYRSRVVFEPRIVLAEFGTEISEEREVRIHDSTADFRYMVLPMQPDGTQDWPLDKLAALVNRDSLIGVSLATQPGTKAGNP
ncbi:MAG: nitrile hydratase subunit alpha [Gammaproteobacteria bacterium]|nr:nitrile hydratase subunit alpha [Gammaproteobacteria bacterium]MDH3858784.1 nitrile hydratase subunit alpha [Gammaproteobacteria bacterium]